MEILGYIDNCLSFENVFFSMFACTFDICIKLLLTYYLLTYDCVPSCGIPLMPGM